MTNEEFLTLCKTENIQKVIFDDLCLGVNELSADYERVFIVFDNQNIMLQNKVLCDTDDDIITEFKIEIVNDINSSEYNRVIEKKVQFISFLKDEYDKYSCLELKYNSYYIFIIAGEHEVIVTAGENEDLKSEFSWE